VPDYERRLTKLEEARGLTGGVHVITVDWMLPNDGDDDAAYAAENEAAVERALAANPAPAGTSLTVLIKHYSSRIA
jgi:hypothetical protein